MQQQIKRLGVIGAGVMGTALIKGLLEKKVLTQKQIWATARRESSCKKIAEALGIHATPHYQEFLADTDMLLICVKPNGMQPLLTQLYKTGLSKKTLVVSVAAGFTLASMEALLDQQACIRAMPNTPCLVGQGMTVIAQGCSATLDQVEYAKVIFESVGQVIELSESHFDAVTGLGGSGPAYIYLMIEALADGGVRVGLPREVAMKIVTQTVLGAAMMVQQTGQHPASLRDDVTTPAGCTIAGLLMMEDGKIRSVLARAVEEAARIAGELGKPKH
jgi:pyrroline-5-carboxylate reductase